MAESALATLRLVEHLYGNQLSLLMTGNHHLGDTLTILHHKILLREINQDHANLSTIVGIDGSWGIQYGDTLLQGQTTTRSYLSLIAYWQGNVQPRRNQLTLQRFQGDGGIETSPQIHASTLWCGILWQWLMTLIDDLYFQHRF